jgi:hypothetical protein
MGKLQFILIFLISSFGLLGIALLIKWIQKIYYQTKGYGVIKVLKVPGVFFGNWINEKWIIKFTSNDVQITSKENKQLNFRNRIINQIYTLGYSLIVEDSESKGIYQYVFCGLDDHQYFNKMFFYIKYYPVSSARESEGVTIISELLIRELV